MPWYRTTPGWELAAAAVDAATGVLYDIVVEVA